MKVVIASLLNETFVDELRHEFPDVTFEVAISAEDQKQHIKDADVFMGLPSRPVFLEAQRLRWLHNPGTGIDKYLTQGPRHFRMGYIAVDGIHPWIRFKVSAPCQIDL